MTKMAPIIFYRQMINHTLNAHRNDRYTAVNAYV